MDAKGDAPPSVPQRVCEILLRDFHETFMDAYAVAAEMTAATAHGANEDIRVALDHLSQALSSSDEEHVGHALAGARDRIAAATVDCLMMAVVSIDARIGEMIDIIETGGEELPEKIRNRRRTLRSIRKKVEASISRNDPDVVPQVSALLEEARDCEGEIESLYPAARLSGPSRWRRTFGRPLRFLVWVAIALAAEILMTHAFSRFGGI